MVKLLRKEWWRDPQAIEVQRREAWVGSRVSHPNLLPVLSASVKEPPFYLVLPKLDGASLAQILTEQGRLDVPRRAVDRAADGRGSGGAVRCDGHDPRRREAGQYLRLADRPRDAARLRLRPGAERALALVDAAAGRHAGLHRAGDGHLDAGGRSPGRTSTAWA